MSSLIRIEDTVPKMEKCSYCARFLNDCEVLVCCQCHKSIHKSCLRCKSTPGDLIGDVFFDMTCCNCLNDSNAVEILKRQKLSWFMVITLALHNINTKLRGLSYKGYFHWRTHIIAFIEKNWKYLFLPDMQRRRNWAGSVSGSLSNNSPEFFVSGAEELEEGGWWKLANEKLTPLEIFKMYTKSSDKKADAADTSIEEPIDTQSKCSRQIPYMGRKPRVATDKKTQSPLNAVQTNLLDFLSQNLADNPCLETDIKDEQLEEEEEEQKQEEHEDNVRIVEVTTFQNNLPAIKVENSSELESDTEMQKNQMLPLAEKTGKRLKRDWRELLKKIDDNPSVTAKEPNEVGELVHMSDELENDLRRKLRKLLYENNNFDKNNNNNNNRSAALLRRFYWKLNLRLKKKQQQFDSPINFLLRSKHQAKPSHANQCILEQYSCHLPKRASLQAYLSGSAHQERFTSVYTKRVLHPYIFRNPNSFPPWLQLMSEIKHVVNQELPTRSSIDYCYLKPCYIAPVNALLQEMFWPGIDMSECLSTPDYTVVALYKKLVIGCGFLVPDVGLNEAYISFMAVRYGWQRAGIGTFMLYHLLQTCMDKDITLHVSATNSAVVLYQKFGFKIEEVCLNFYEKFMPHDSKDSRHAFFLRLSR